MSIFTPSLSTLYRVGDSSFVDSYQALQKRLEIRIQVGGGSLGWALLRFSIQGYDKFPGLGHLLTVEYRFYCE